MVNLNELAEVIAAAEGGNREVDITQIKQIMKIFLEEMGKLSNDEVIELVNRYR